MKSIEIRYFVLSTSIAFSGCAHQPYGDAYDPPGFFMGIWHGFVAPFALVGGIFSDIRIYAFPNSGWFYDFGFMTGLLIFLIWIISLLVK